MEARLYAVCKSKDSLPLGGTASTIRGDASSGLLPKTPRGLSPSRNSWMTTAILIDT